MGTTPGSFYSMFVKPNFDDYLARPDDIRLGFNASITAFQLRDILFAFYRKHHPAKLRWKDLPEFHRDLVTREPLFLTVQSVATVYKHLHPNKGFYEVGSPGALWALRVPSIDLKATWDNTKGDVMVRRRQDGTDISLTAALSAVVEKLWPSILPTEEA